MSTCRVCRKPIKECRKADKQIKICNDFETEFLLKSTESRFNRALIGILGGYNYTLQIHSHFYFLPLTRLVSDTVLSLPLCVVYEDDDEEEDVNNAERLREARNFVIEENRNKLPLPKRYHNKLYAFLPSLPQAD